MLKTVNKWSESDNSVYKKHASRKFYDLVEKCGVSRSYPVKMQLDVMELFSYLENNIIGRNYKFNGPFGSRNALYCDYTASGRSVHFIEDYINNEVLPAYGNTHTTTSVTSLQTTLFRHEARNIVRNAVNASEYDSVIFVGNGATGAIHKLIHAMKPKNPVVFVGPFEHHSNLLPWRELSSVIIRIPENSHGLVNINILEKYLLEYKCYGREMIGCFSAASNITGIITDVDEISSLLHKHGALAFWDYVSAAPYMKIDINPVNPGENQGLAYKDAVFISPHKFLGGVGAPGILIAKKSLFRNPVPYESGGGTIFFVSRESHRYLQDVEAREEGGTPSIVGAVRAGLVFQLKEAISSEAIVEKDKINISKAMKVWKEVDNLIILGSTDALRLPIFSFLVLHKCSGLFLHHNFVAAVLNDVFGIQCRGGCACAGPYALDLLGIDENLAEKIEQHLVEDSNLDRVHLRRIGEYSHREVLRPGFVRLNLPYFMSDECIDFVISSVKLTCEQAWKLLPLYILNPETGEWKHHSHQVMKDRKWLGMISYSGGKFSYPGNVELEDESPLNYKERLYQAEQLFLNAENMCLKVKLSDQSIIFDSDSDKLRSFILPSEAQSYLQKVTPQIHSSPFFPRGYSYNKGVALKESFLKNDQVVSDELNGHFNRDSINEQLNEVFGRLQIIKLEGENCSHDQETINSNKYGSVGHGDAQHKNFLNEIIKIEKSLKEICDTIFREKCDLKGKVIVNRSKKEVMDTDRDIQTCVFMQNYDDSKGTKLKKKRGKMWHCPPKSILKPTLKALEEFDMIKNNDRILVCLSGGKDSLSLLHMMKQYQFISQQKGIQFSLGAVTVDPQTESYNPSSLKEYLAKLGVPYFYEEQCIIDQAAALPEQCTSICSFCSRMKRGRIYACARREGYNVLAFGQHLDDLTESFFMSVFHNGRLGTMKANYTVKEGDLRVIRPLVYVREEALRKFAIESRLPVIAENCPACFEAPKERHRMKQLLAAQEVLFPKLYSSLKSAILPIMSINRTGIDGRHLFTNDEGDLDAD